MPSGYTSKIYEGNNISGKEFILTCARAFGALIEMRDDPLDAEIPEEFKPDNRYLKRIEGAKNELDKIQNMNNDEIQKIIDEDYVKQIEHNKNYYKEKLELKNRYQKTLEDVQKWQPPTEEHINLKEYAIKQLEDSIKWDCSYLDKYKNEIINKLTPEEWKQNKISYCLSDIEYHTRNYKEEIDRINERNLWIKQLRDSL